MRITQTLIVISVLIKPGIAVCQVLEKLELFRSGRNGFTIEKARDFIDNGSSVFVKKGDPNFYLKKGHEEADTVAFNFSKIINFKKFVSHVEWIDSDNILILSDTVTKAIGPFKFQLNQASSALFKISLVDPKKGGKIGRINFVFKDVELLYITERLYLLEQELYENKDSVEFADINLKLEKLTQNVTIIENEDEDAKIERIENNFESLLDNSLKLFDNSKDAAQTRDMGILIDELIEYLNPIYDSTLMNSLNSLQAAYVSKNGVETRASKQIGALSAEINSLTKLKQDYSTTPIAQRDRKSQVSFIVQTMDIITGGRFQNIINVGRSFFALLEPTRKLKEANEKIESVYQFLVKIQQKIDGIGNISMEFKKIEFAQYEIFSDTLWVDLTGENSGLVKYHESKDGIQDFRDFISGVNSKSVEEFKQLDKESKITKGQEFNNYIKIINAQISSFNRDISNLITIIKALKTQIKSKEVVNRLVSYLEKRRLQTVRY
ncbi:MAG: hypothetical protein AAGA64_09510 [Bacteroidota bacterium]